MNIESCFLIQRLQHFNFSPQRCASQKAKLRVQSGDCQGATGDSVGVAHRQTLSEQFVHYRGERREKDEAAQG